MKRLKIMKSYIIVWIFIYFMVVSNIEAFKIYFFATLSFNLAIMTILSIGVIMVMKAAVNLVMLAGTFGTLAYKKDNLEFYLQDIEKIMPPSIALMFQTRAKKGMLLFTADEAREVVSMIEEKFVNQNRYTNYFTGTVLMIGLLGTFSGLLISIDNMGTIILSLSGDIDLAKVISDFAGPLGGMAVGFGSSLFGVISAIILGLMGYILNKNQEQLINGVEDWLKSRTIDSSGSVEAGADGELPEQTSSFMDVFVNNLTDLTEEMGKISQTNEQLYSITVASIRQARDENELNLEVFQNISGSLKNIDINAHDTTKLLSQQFSSLQISMNTNHQQMILQQQDSMHLMIEKIENALEVTHTNITQKFQEISSTSIKEISLRADEIALFLTSLDKQLQAKQKLLLEMQTSDHANQATNEELLAQLIQLLKDSSIKLDNEQELLSNIHQQLGSNADDVKNNYRGISKLIESFSLTLQSELNTLDALHKVQKTQSQTIEESLTTSKNIDSTLKLSYEINERFESQLNNITSKIAYVSQQIHKNNSETTEILNSKLHQLQEIAKHSKDQDTTLVEMLGTNKENSQTQLESLEKISLNIDEMKEEFLDKSGLQQQEQLETLEKLSYNVEQMKEELLATNESNQKQQLENFTQVTNAILDKETTFSSTDEKKSGGIFGKLFK